MDVDAVRSIAQIAGLVFWLAWVIGVVLFDRARLRRREDENAARIPRHVGGMLWAGLLVCGPIVLPYYFHTTRQTGMAALAGVGLAILGLIGSNLVSLVIYFVGILFV
jgi:hypothetical protein